MTSLSYSPTDFNNILEVFHNTTRLHIGPDVLPLQRAVAVLHRSFIESKTEELDRPTCILFYGLGGFAKSQLVYDYFQAVYLYNMSRLGVNKEDSYTYRKLYLIHKKITETVNNLYAKQQERNKLLDTTEVINTEELTQQAINSLSYGEQQYYKKHSHLLKKAIETVSVAEPDIYTGAFGRGTTQAEVMGGINFTLLSREHDKEIKHHFNNSGFAHEIFCAEEFFDAKAVIEMFKDILESGVYKTDNTNIPITTKLFIVCSNIEPKVLKENMSYAALLERFRINVNMSDFKIDSTTSYNILSKAAKAMFPNQPYTVTIAEILSEVLTHNNFSALSPRVMITTLAKTVKYLDEVTADDLVKAVDLAVSTDTITFSSKQAQAIFLHVQKNAHRLVKNTGEAEKKFRALASSKVLAMQNTYAGPEGCTQEVTIGDVAVKVNYEYMYKGAHGMHGRADNHIIISPEQKEMQLQEIVKNIFEPAVQRLENIVYPIVGEDFLKVSTYIDQVFHYEKQQASPMWVFHAYTLLMQAKQVHESILKSNESVDAVSTPIELVGMLHNAFIENRQDLGLATLLDAPLHRKNLACLVKWYIKTSELLNSLSSILTGPSDTKTVNTISLYSSDDTIWSTLYLGSDALGTLKEELNVYVQENMINPSAIFNGRIDYTDHSKELPEKTKTSLLIYNFFYYRFVGGIGYNPLVYLFSSTDTPKDIIKLLEVTSHNTPLNYYYHEVVSLELGNIVKKLGKHFVNITEKPVTFELFDYLICVLGDVADRELPKNAKPLTTLLRTFYNQAIKNVPVPAEEVIEEGNIFEEQGDWVKFVESALNKLGNYIKPEMYSYFLRDGVDRGNINILEVLVEALKHFPAPTGISNEKYVEYCLAGCRDFFNAYGQAIQDYIRSEPNILQNRDLYVPVLNSPNHQNWETALVELNGLLNKGINILSYDNGKIMIEEEVAPLSEHTCSWLSHSIELDEDEDTTQIKVHAALSNLLAILADQCFTDEQKALFKHKGFSHYHKGFNAEIPVPPRLLLSLAINENGLNVQTAYAQMVEALREGQNYFTSPKDLNNKFWLNINRFVIDTENSLHVLESFEDFWNGFVVGIISTLLAIKHQANLSAEENAEKKPETVKLLEFINFLPKVHHNKYTLSNLEKKYSQLFNYSFEENWPSKDGSITNHMVSLDSLIKLFYILYSRQAAYAVNMFLDDMVVNEIVYRSIESFGELQSWARAAVADNNTTEFATDCAKAKKYYDLVLSEVLVNKINP